MVDQVEHDVCAPAFGLVVEHYVAHVDVAHLGGAQARVDQTLSH
jgi:hypothetical protein